MTSSIVTIILMALLFLACGFAGVQLYFAFVKYTAHSVANIVLTDTIEILLKDAVFDKEQNTFVVDNSKFTMTIKLKSIENS